MLASLRIVTPKDRCVYVRGYDLTPSNSNSVYSSSTIITPKTNGAIKIANETESAFCFISNLVFTL